MSLISLADELIESIVSYLEGSSSETKKTYENRHERFKRELLGFVNDEFRDIMNLSVTCKRLRNHLLPRVFATVLFSNDTRVSDSALVAARAHGKYIKKLRFIAYDPPEDNASEDVKATESAKYISAVIPETALELFRADSMLLPNLDRFVIRFAHNFDKIIEVYGQDYERYQFYFFDQEIGISVSGRKTVCEPLSEDNSNMLCLWANTYQALSTNWTTPTLEIEQWPPHKSSTFDTEEWRAYLGRLERLEISILGLDNGVGWATSTCTGYRDDIGKMKQYFFDYLSSVRTLKFTAAEVSKIGNTGNCHMDLPFGVDTMPALENVELTNIFMGRQLLEFLKAHSAHLRTVVIDGSAATYDHETRGRDDLSWADFFVLLAKTHFVVLSSFDLRTEAPPKNWRTSEFLESSQYVEELKAMYELQEKHPHLRLFEHSWVSDKYGDPMRDEKRYVRCFQDGRAQAAYERFMGMINRGGK